MANKEQPNQNEVTQEPVAQTNPELVATVTNFAAVMSNPDTTDAQADQALEEVLEAIDEI